jgi:hypothetical protein
LKAKLEIFIFMFIIVKKHASTKLCFLDAQDFYFVIPNYSMALFEFRI